MEELCTYNVLAVDLASLKRLDSCHEDLINISFSAGSTGHIRAWASKHPVPVCDNKMQRKIPGRSYPTLNMESNKIRICSNDFKWQVGKSTSFIPRYTCLDHLPISRCNADAAGVLGTELVVCQVQAGNKRQLLQSFLPVVALGTNQVLKHPIASSSPISSWKTERDWIRVKSEPPCVYHCNTCCG